MTSRPGRWLPAILLAHAAGCGHDHPPLAGDLDAGPPSFGPADPATCLPPDLMLVLDRTLSMAQSPDGRMQQDTPAGRDATKWGLAAATVHAVTQPPMDAQIRFGVVLLPRDPGGGACVTLSDANANRYPSNPTCEPGEVVVKNAVGQSAAIAAAVDRDTTRLCDSTPIGAALATARDALAGIAQPDRRQFVVLVTDGGENCDTQPLNRVAELARAGISTFVVGFAQLDDAGLGSVDTALLDDMACAGLTASNANATCRRDRLGYFAGAKSHDAPLFYLASSGDELLRALSRIAGDVCCGCAR